MDGDVGKTILSRDGGKEGIIERMVTRWCAGCQKVRLVYSAKWEDGRRTFPCPAGCKDRADGKIQIL